MSRKVLKILSVVVCVMFLLTSFAACGKAPAANQETDEVTTQGAETTQAAEVKRPKVGVLWDFLAVERRVKGKQYLEENAKKYGFDIVFQNANGDEKLQMQQAENLITQGVDVLVMLAQNAEAAGPAIEQAKKAGIKTIAFDRPIPNCEPDAYVGIDSSVVGDLMADYVYKMVPKGNYALVCGASTDPLVKTFKDGWFRVIQPAIDKGDIKIISDTSAEGWDPANAMKNVENFLTKSQDKVDVVLAMNDGTAGGTVHALKARGLNGKVLVTGQDGELAACQRIVEGDHIMTVWRPDIPLSEVLAKAIMALATNQPLETNGKVLNNGKIDVPAVLFAPVVVDKNNMAL